MKPDHLCRVGKGARAELFRLASLTARAVPTRSVANGGHGAQSAPLPTLRTLMLRSDDAEVWVLQASREVADRYRAVQCHRQVSERVGRVGAPVVHGVGLGQWMQATVLPARRWVTMQAKRSLRR